MEINSFQELILVGFSVFLVLISLWSIASVMVRNFLQPDYTAWARQVSKKKS